jgi:Raf kinase inhibitor-like YbhB/YbcL family protein
MALNSDSPVLTQNHEIPNQFSRDAGHVSPPIEWQGGPAGTRSYAIIVEDPDAPKGMSHHWAAYNIPPDALRLPEGAGSREQGVALQMAFNEFGTAHYDCPQPPPRDGAHRYHFRLFALDVPELELADGCAARDVLAAIQDHALAEADLIAPFER